MREDFFTFRVLVLFILLYLNNAVLNPAIGSTRKVLLHKVAQLRKREREREEEHKPSDLMSLISVS